MQDTVEISIHPRRRNGEERISVSLRIPKRLYLHAREHLSLVHTFEDAMASALRSLKIDYTKPHDDEIVGEYEGRKITLKEGKKHGLYNADGELNPPANASDS